MHSFLIYGHPMIVLHDGLCYKLWDMNGEDVVCEQENI